MFAPVHPRRTYRGLTELEPLMRTKLGSRSLQSLQPAAKPYEVRDTELKGLLVRVQPSGISTYMCDFRRPDGRRARVKLGRTEVISIVQARDEARKILGEVAVGHDPVALRARAHALNLRHFITTRYEPWAE